MNDYLSLSTALDDRLRQASAVLTMLLVNDQFKTLSAEVVGNVADAARELIEQAQDLSRDMGESWRMEGRRAPSNDDALNTVRLGLQEIKADAEAIMFSSGNLEQFLAKRETAQAA